MSPPRVTRTRPGGLRRPLAFVALVALVAGCAELPAASGLPLDDDTASDERPGEPSEAVAELRDDGREPSARGDVPEGDGAVADGGAARPSDGALPPSPESACAPAGAAVWVFRSYDDRDDYASRSATSAPAGYGLPFGQAANDPAPRTTQTFRCAPEGTRLPTRPVYRLYSARLRDWMLALEPSEGAALGYVSQGEVCRVFRRAEPGTSALRRFARPLPLNHRALPSRFGTPPGFVLEGELGFVCPADAT